MLSVIVSCLQAIDFIVIICSIVYDLWHKYKSWSHWKQLTIAKWVYYFSAIAAFFLSMGLKATMEDAGEKTIDDILICILFGIACVLCIAFMIIQKNWRIQYNENILIVRTSFRKNRIYYLDQLVFKPGNRINRLFCCGKEIAQWDTWLINLKEDIALCVFFSRALKTRNNS